MTDKIYETAADLILSGKITTADVSEDDFQIEMSDRAGLIDQLEFISEGALKSMLQDCGAIEGGTSYSDNYEALRAASNDWSNGSRNRRNSWN